MGNIISQLYSQRTYNKSIPVPDQATSVIGADGLGESRQVKLKNVSLARSRYESNASFREFQDARKRQVEMFIQQSILAQKITFLSRSNHFWTLRTSGFSITLQIDDDTQRIEFVNELSKVLSFVRVKFLDSDTGLGFGMDQKNQVLITVPFVEPLSPTMFWIVTIGCILLAIILYCILSLLNPVRYGEISFLPSLETV